MKKGYKEQYDEMQRKAMAEAGVRIPDEGPFIPGEHCRGAKPFLNSQECYKICFGTHGIFTIMLSGNPPCLDELKAA